MQVLEVSARYFVIIAAKLVLLFVGVSFLVGLFQEYVPPKKIQQIMGSGRRRVVGNFIGAAFGSLTPFCSCSTIPITLGLLNSGVPFGAAMSFLIASPLLNPVIMALLLTLLGVKYTLYYVAVVFPSAVLVGLWWDSMGLSAEVKKVRLKKTGDNGEETRTGGYRRVIRAFQGAVLIFKQVLPWLLTGAAIGSFIYGFVPADLVAKVAGPQQRLAVPVAAIVGIPMYIRVETILPISNVLINKGMSVGAVMALVIGGAGASLPEITLLGAIFKYKLVITFVITILLIAVLAGSIFLLVN